TAMLDRLHFSVVEARILNSSAGMAMDTFLLLEADGQQPASADRAEELRSHAARARAKRPDPAATAQHVAPAEALSDAAAHRFPPGRRAHPHGPGVQRPPRPAGRGGAGAGGLRGARARR